MLLMMQTVFRDSGEILLMVLEAMNSMQTSLENVVSRLTSVEKILAERSLAASETFTSAGDSTNNWASTSAERLDENQRAMLLQRPMVFNGKEQILPFKQCYKGREGVGGECRMEGSIQATISR